MNDHYPRVCMRSLILLILACFPLDASAQECIHPDGQPYYNHWLASIDTIKAEQAKNEAAKETITQWSARALLCEAELETLRPPLIECDRVSDFLDGGGGRLWKPKSDNTGQPVFLLPLSYCDLLPGRSEDVTAYIERTGEQVGDRYRTCEHNGPRYHHDVFYSGSEPLLIQLRRADGITECLSVPNPTQRFD